jgi:signal transduction histidine kinase/ActR/RegA family two-component response regulator
MVTAPLRAKNNTLGILLSARSEPAGFNSEECEFLKQLGDHVALAVYQNQIYTALQAAYDHLRQSQQAAMQQERLRALGQMASGIAHDINNALSPMGLYTEWLLEAEPDLSKRAREYLSTIQRAIGDVAQTVARLREFYRPQRPTLAPVDLGILVKQVLDLTRARWSDIPQQNGCTIRAAAELAPDLPMIEGVESEIREALTNLVFNALDAMPEGGNLTIRTRVVEAPAGGNAEQDGRHVDLEVEDSGIGMDEDTRRRCLEPFFTTKGERGTGLGLAMVYGTARRHNAQVEIDSQRGIGTLVRLRFEATASCAEATESMVSLARSVAPRLRILVIDDDPLLIRSLRDLLESDGHTLVTAPGGREGIVAFESALAARERFAVVITDLGMPDVDGRKVATAVKSASPETPVILMTGWGHRFTEDGEIITGVDAIMNKPPQLAVLRGLLVRVTAERSGQTRQEIIQAVNT